MSAFNWFQFLAEHSIPNIERGPNVKRGERNIKCPFCGSADPSYHMGLNQSSGYWACWRNRDHRGKSPVRLLMRLLNVPHWKALNLAGIDAESWVDPDGFDAVAARVMGREALASPAHVRREFLQFPCDVKPIAGPGGARFAEYLAYDRGFGAAHVERVCSEYGLRYSSTGRYRSRVVLPYTLEEELVAWTARAIAPAEIRYLDLARDECIVPIKQTLYNHDCVLHGGKYLVVQEGPLDALKVDAFGAEGGVRSVALSTNSVSADQLYMLEEASSQFDCVIVMMDSATDLGVVDSMRMVRDLRSIRNIKIAQVPYGLKDGAEMTPRQVRRWVEKITN